MHQLKRHRQWTVFGIAAAAVMSLTATAVTPVAAATMASRLSADLDGVPIPLTDVGLYDCHDFDAPRIHCFTITGQRDAAVGGTAALAAAGVAYVVIYDQASFAGPSMVLSDDYSVLALIGWNDRISSFKGQGSQSGRFWTDWFGGGSPYSFCCNQQVPSLGSYDNTFSSVSRT